MRFSLLLSLFAGSAVVFGFPSVQLSERATEFSPSQTELLVRNDGDVNMFYGRQVTAAEIYARDSALAVATGSDLGARDFIDEDDIQDLVLRHLEYDIEERDIDLEPRAVAAVARAVVQGVIKVVQLIKGKIEADKGVCTSFSSSISRYADSFTLVRFDSAEASTPASSSESPCRSSPNGTGLFVIPSTVTNLTGPEARIGSTDMRNSLFPLGRPLGMFLCLNAPSYSLTINVSVTRSIGSGRAPSPVKEMEVIST